MARQRSGDLFPTDQPIPASQMIGRELDVREIAADQRSTMAPLRGVTASALDRPTFVPRAWVTEFHAALVAGEPSVVAYGNV